MCSICDWHSLNFGRLFGSLQDQFTRLHAGSQALCTQPDYAVGFAGEMPVCRAKGDGECELTAPMSNEYCAGQPDTATCPRFQDFEALYLRGEQQVAECTAVATAATNSLVFNAFIWLQVCTVPPLTLLNDLE